VLVIEQSVIAGNSNITGTAAAQISQCTITKGGFYASNGGLLSSKANEYSDAGEGCFIVARSGGFIVSHNDYFHGQAIAAVGVATDGRIDLHEPRITDINGCGVVVSGGGKVAINTGSIYGVRYGVHARDGAIFELSGITVTGATKCGLWAGSGATGFVHKSQFLKCRTDAEFTESGAIEIKDSKFESSEAVALLCHKSIEARFHSCEFTGSKSIGVSLVGEAVQPLFEQCIFKDNTEIALRISAGAHPRIIGGSAAGSKLGIVNVGGTVVAEDFTISGCSDVAISISQNGKVIGRKLTITDNPKFGVQVVTNGSVLHLIDSVLFALV
jgi:hypothetical protein